MEMYYSLEYLDSLSEKELLKLMEEHGYEEGYKGYSKSELVTVLSNVVK